MQQTKKAIRQKFKLLRNRLTNEQVKTDSAQIIEKLKKIPQFQQANSFFIYVAANNEVRTQELIGELLAKNKVVTAPKVVDEKIMIPIQIHDLKSLRTNHMGILEPTSNEKYLGKINVAIVPGVAFTAKGDRLGMGGGNYDRYLSKNPDIFSIALAYKFQIVNKLPIEEKDKKVDMVVTTDQKD